MKIPLTNRLIHRSVHGVVLPVLALSSTQVFAHSGHMTNDAVHGLLHVEHIVALAALGVVAYVIKLMRDK